MKLLISDPHYHKWNLFSRPGDEGVNSRLEIQIEQTKLAVIESRKIADSKKEALQVVFAGDIFHVRGNIPPTVLNPVREMFRWIVAQGVDVYVLAGNHDLESRDSNGVNNAARCLEDLGVIVVDDKPRYFEALDCVLVPWVHDLDHLRKLLSGISGKLKAAGKLRQTDLVIHAPVNGVLKGLPDTGLEPEELQKLGFRTVWSGHYHNAKDLLLEAPGEVISIGALNHHTWGDVGSVAGYWVDSVIDPSVRKHLVTNAPRFITFDGTNDSDVPGNYCQAEMFYSDTKEIEQVREHLNKLGAAGVVVKAVKRKATSGATRVTTLSSLRASVGDYITKHVGADPDLQALCGEILTDIGET